MDRHTSGCLLCGKELAYSSTSRSARCVFCGEMQEANTCCVDSHFVCDGCHSLPATDFIEKACLTTDVEDPLELAIQLMKNPSVNMHGPEHHFLVPAVLLTAYYHASPDRASEGEKLKIAKTRASSILGGFCGYYGTCGAAVGAGIFMSLITNATPLSVDEWRMSNLITSQCLHSIALHGGPRCCKRDSFLAIIETVGFLRNHFSIFLPLNPNIRCSFTGLNKECKKANCIFFASTEMNAPSPDTH